MKFRKPLGERDLSDADASDDNDVSSDDNDASGDHQENATSK